MTNKEKRFIKDNLEEIKVYIEKLEKIKGLGCYWSWIYDIKVFKK